MAELPHNINVVLGKKKGSIQFLFHIYCNLELFRQCILLTADELCGDWTLNLERQNLTSYNTT